MQRIGVSPAFIISAATSAFLATDYLAAIQRVAGLGFSAIQLEVFRQEAVAEWTPAVTAQVRALLEAEGLLPTQFVAHFLLHDFQSSHALSQRGGFHSFQRFLEVAEAFPRCPVITVPIPPFACPQNCDQQFLVESRASLVDYLGQLLELTDKAGKRLALEIMPYALIGGTEGFLRLRQEAGLESLAYNFDTGHAWARKEPMALIPALLGEAIAGTHLCDNQANESLKWRPGTGTIDFVALLENLAVAGYQGSLDLEILCPPDAVDREYAAGRLFVESLVGSCRTSLA
jgi:sugar phosphate isomerase/epimerase